MSESGTFFIKHRFAKTVGLILAVIAFDHIWVYYVLKGLVLGMGPYEQLICMPYKFEFLKVVVFAPLVEEALFRIAPVMLGLRLYLKGGIYRAIFWIWIFAISCVLFGYIHGGPGFIITAGVGGLAYAWLCVKIILLYGVRYHNEDGELTWMATRDSLKVAYLSCCIAHAVYNAIVTIALFAACPETTTFTLF